MHIVLTINEYQLLIEYFVENSFTYIEASVRDKLKNSHYFAQINNNKIHALITINESELGLKVLFKNSDNFNLENSLEYLSSFDKAVYLMDVNENLKKFYSRHGFIEKEKLVKYEISPYKINVDIHLEKALEKDLEELSELDRLSFGDFWKQGEKSLLFAINYEKGYFLTYRENNEIVAYICFNEKHINRLAVLPRYQGKSIGKKIMQKTIDFLWEKGVESLGLNTQISNEKSRPLYESLGFVEKNLTYVLEKII